MKYLKYVELNTPEKLTTKERINNERSIWEILTFQKQKPKISEIDRRGKLNEKYSHNIKEVLNLKNIFWELREISEQ